MYRQHTSDGTSVGRGVKALVLVLLLAYCQAALGQSDEPCPRAENSHGRFGVGDGQSCNANGARFVSSC